MKRRSVGNLGEKIAIGYLIKKNFRILETNYLKRSGEIDIIAFDNNRGEYVFIEVKTRRNRKFGHPEESVDDRKIEKISDTAETWLIEKNIKDSDWRIDVISIEWKGTAPEISHLQNIN